MIAMQYGSGEGSRSNGLTVTSLWTNSSPTSSFAAQTVNLSSSAGNYVMLAVYYEFSTSNTVRTMSIVPVASLKSGDEGMCIIAAWGANRTGVRRFTLASDTTVTFTACGYNGGTDNTYGVPVAIYGIR